VIVGLGDGVANSKAGYVGLVLGEDALVGEGIEICQPRKEGWADVKADIFKVAELGVWLVALSVDAFVPVLVRGGAGLGGDDARERVFPRRLVEVAVDAESFDGHEVMFYDGIDFIERCNYNA